MGLFGKKKRPEEILAEGRAQYENGDSKKAFLTLHGLAGKGEPQACYYVGKIYLERKEKNLARPFLTTAAKGGVSDTAQLLAKEFGIREYLPKEAATQPVPACASRSKADNAPSVDDLLEELEETGKLIQDTKRELKQAEKKMSRVEEISRPKPQVAAERPVPPASSASVPASAQVPQAVPAKSPVLSPTEKSEEELSPEEKYQKGMELFRAGKYEEAYTLLRAVCKPLYLKWNKDKNIYPAGQAALWWMCETANGTELDASSAFMHYRNAIDNATGVPDKNGMAGFVRLTARAEQPTLKACDMALDYVRQLGTDEVKTAIPALEKKLAEARLREKYAEWELTEGNVQAIFNRCLAKEGEDFYNVQVIGLELTKNPSDIVQLSSEKMEKNEQNIRYLLGQLKTIHIPNVKVISLQEGFFRYDNHVWTKDFNFLFQLYDLALGCVYFRGFGQTEDGNISSLIDYKHITPTLSPKDPAFPAWWEAHKGEWED